MFSFLRVTIKYLGYFIFFITGLALLILPAYSSPANVDARYIISLGGINFAKVKISFSDDDKNYKISLGANISGVGTLVASGAASALIVGKSKNDKLVPTKLNIKTEAKREKFSISVQYNGGNASGFQIEPMLINEINRVAIERKHLLNVSDPLGSFILKGRALDENLCRQNLRIFSGLERFDIKMRFVEKQLATSKKTAYQGPVILCAMKYVPIAGHYADSEITSYLANSKRLLIWYAPLGKSGKFIPYRVLVGTSAGDLSMVLTGLNI